MNATKDNDTKCIATDGNGPTLWDCPCADCRDLRIDWARTIGKDR